MPATAAIARRSTQALDGKMHPVHMRIRHWLPHGGRWVVRSTFVFQCFRRLNAKRPSCRDDACERTAHRRSQCEDRRSTEIIEMHIR
jgi:hypothetical protein